LKRKLFHYKFIRIHPFDDGNGRLARILMNLILMKSGYPPVVIKTEAKNEYYKALQQADGGNELFFSKYICNQLITSLEIFLKGAKGENIFDEIDDKKRFAMLERRIETAMETKTLKVEEILQKIEKEVENFENGLNKKF